MKLEPWLNEFQGGVALRIQRTLPVSLFFIPILLVVLAEQFGNLRGNFKNVISAAETRTSRIGEKYGSQLGKGK